MHPYTAEDIVRFHSKFLKEPAGLTCWVWTKALADDGYGRFWIGPGWVVRPHRFAYEIHANTTLHPDQVIEHRVCDNPLCVRYAGDPATDHLVLSTQADNAAQMGSKGRGGGRKKYGVDRAQFAARSRRLRDAILTGASPEEVALIIATKDQPGEPTLF